jgi:hypothetical protein
VNAFVLAVAMELSYPPSATVGAKRRPSTEFQYLNTPGDLEKAALEELPFIH